MNLKKTKEVVKLKNVEIRGDERAIAADSRIVPATEEDWG